MTGPDDLTEPERAALQALREDAAAPPRLEEAVVAALARRGLVRASRSKKWLAPVAAAAAAFGLGILAGSAMAHRPAPAAAAERYVLLLEGADTPTPEEELQRVAEYRSWARKEAGAGRLLSGEKLESQAVALGAGASRPSGGEAVRGFFIIVAKDEAEALAIARNCPHLRHGGRVVVRKIART
jgi:hypothetical protein